MQDTSTLSPDFQLSIPKAICAAKGWHAGQVFAFVPKPHGVMLVPVPAREELAGLVRGADPSSYRERPDGA